MTKIISQSSPHLRGKNSTFQMMMEFFGCVVLLWICSMIFYGTFQATNPVRNYAGWYYSLKVLGMGVAAMLFSVIADALFYLPIFWKDASKLQLKEGETRVKRYFGKWLFNYSYVTGLILALLLPVGTPFYVIVISSFISTFVFKNLFGGFGKNIFNPAVIGRIFAQLCFGSSLKTYLGPKGAIDISTGASLTPSLAGNDFGTMSSPISFLDAFLGKYFGTIGETLAIVIIVCGVYLIVRKIIDFRVTVTYIVVIFFSYLLAFASAKRGVASFELAATATLSGGVLFGAVFCMTDPVTTPTSRTGKLIYSAGAAIVTVMIRMFASAPEGVAFSILVMNLFTPLIDKLFIGRSHEKLAVKYTVISILFIIPLLFGIASGCTSQAKESKSIENVAFVTREASNENTNTLYQLDVNEDWRANL